MDWPWMSKFEMPPWLSGGKISKCLLKALDSFFPSTSRKSRKCRLSPILGRHLHLSTELADTSVYIGHCEVFQLLHSTQPGRPQGSTLFISGLTNLLPMLSPPVSTALRSISILLPSSFNTNLSGQLTSWWVETSTVCRTIPSCLPYHFLPSPLFFVPISRAEKWLF